MTKYGIHTTYYNKETKTWEDSKTTNYLKHERKEKRCLKEYLKME